MKDDFPEIPAPSALEAQNAGMYPYDPESKVVRAKVDARREIENHRLRVQRLADLETAAPQVPTAVEVERLAFLGSNWAPDKPALEAKIRAHKVHVAEVERLRDLLPRSLEHTRGAVNGIQFAESELATHREQLKKQEAAREAQAELLRTFPNTITSRRQ